MIAPGGASGPPQPASRARARAFTLYWLPVGAYVLLIFALSSLPGDAAPVLFPHMDKLEHLLEYSLFGLLLGRALRHTVRGRKAGLLAGLLTLGLGALVAAADELYQGRVSDRQSDVLDWATDVAALGLAIAWTQVVHHRPLFGRRSVRESSRSDPREAEGAGSGKEGT